MLRSTLKLVLVAVITAPLAAMVTVEVSFPVLELLEIRTVPALTVRLQA